MNWLEGFTGAYFAEYIDPETWRDIQRFEITGGSITKTVDELRESASIDCTDYPQGAELWIRVYLDARQHENAERVALFTGLATSPAIDIDGTRVSHTLECYSVLKPAEDILLQRGWYIPAETSGALAVKRLLSVTPAPVIIDDNSPILTEAIIAEDGETHMTMVDKVLNAMGWRLRIDGDGTIHVTTTPTNAVATYDPVENDGIEPQLTVTHDWFNVPNVFRAVSEGVSGIARDESPDSPYSVPNRGREVWMEEDGCELSDYETIAQYAVRRLSEEQKAGETVKYTRRFNPAIQPSDVVLLHYPGQGVEGFYEVQSQSMELGYGCPVDEEANYIG